MPAKQGGGHADSRLFLSAERSIIDHATSARRASLLENRLLGPDGLRDAQRFPRSLKKRFRHVFPFSIDHLRFSIQNIFPIAPHDFRWTPGSGQSSHLFGANRDRLPFFHQLQDFIHLLVPLVKAAMDAGETRAHDFFLQLGFSLSYGKIT